MKFTNTLFVLSAALAGSEAKLSWFSSCPTFDTQDNFDISQYAGRWYERSRDLDTIFELGGDCVTATYGSLEGGTANDISVTNRQWLWPLFRYFSIDGCARCDTSGNCKVNFSGDCSSEALDGDSNYHVISTDYTSYSIVYDCSPVFSGLAIYEAMWFLSRDPVPSKEVQSTVYDIIGEQFPNYGAWFWQWEGRQGENALCGYE